MVRRVGITNETQNTKKPIKWRVDMNKWVVRAVHVTRSRTWSLQLDPSQSQYKISAFLFNLPHTYKTCTSSLVQYHTYLYNFHRGKNSITQTCCHANVIENSVASEWQNFTWVCQAKYRWSIYSLYVCERACTLSKQKKGEKVREEGERVK